MFTRFMHRSGSAFARFGRALRRLHESQVNAWEAYYDTLGPDRLEEGLHWVHGLTGWRLAGHVLPDDRTPAAR
jgi:hypothetical protein